MLPVFQDRPLSPEEQRWWEITGTTTWCRCCRRDGKSKPKLSKPLSEHEACSTPVIYCGVFWWLPCVSPRFGR